MTEEEKKAIDIINYIKNKTPFIFWYENKPYNRKETIETVLKLIEKQQKELEQEKEKNKELLKYYVSKDQIKGKIKEYEDFRKKYPLEFRNNKMRPIITVLKELMEVDNE